MVLHPIALTEGNPLVHRRRSRPVKTPAQPYRGRAVSNPAHLEGSALTSSCLPETATVVARAADQKRRRKLTTGLFSFIVFSRSIRHSNIIRLIFGAQINLICTGSPACRNDTLFALTTFAGHFFTSSPQSSLLPTLTERVTFSFSISLTSAFALIPVVSSILRPCLIS